MIKQTIFTSEYATPTTRVIQIDPARCIAGSDKMSDMNSNSIYEEDFE